MPGCSLIQYIQEKKKKKFKNVTMTFWPGKSVRSFIPRGGKGLTLLISQASLSGFYDPVA